MATIVKHKTTGLQYVLLGTGFGAFHSKNENLFFGNWAPDVVEGQFAMICVCNQAGKIGWIDSSEVVVESIDGQDVTSAFPTNPPE